MKNSVTACKEKSNVRKSASLDCCKKYSVEDEHKVHRKSYADIVKKNAEIKDEIHANKDELKIFRLNGIVCDGMVENAGEKRRKLCRYCGRIYKWGSQYCSAYGKICKRCDKLNHIAAVCQSIPKRELSRKCSTIS